MSPSRASRPAQSVLRRAGPTGDPLMRPPAPPLQPPDLERALRIWPTLSNVFSVARHDNQHRLRRALSTLVSEVQVQISGEALRVAGSATPYAQSTQAFPQAELSMKLQTLCSLLQSGALVCARHQIPPQQWDLITQSMRTLVGGGEPSSPPRAPPIHTSCTMAGPRDLANTG